MVIDMNVSPAFIEELGPSEGQLEFCREQMGLYKTDAIPVAEMRTLARVSGIDKLCLMPLDLSTTAGGYLGTNEQVAWLVGEHPDLFIGFATVDPAREDALDIAERALGELGLSGLYLHPSHQGFDPAAPELRPLYELVERMGKPIAFHAGMSCRPGVTSELSHPLRFERVAAEHPGLRMCLQHFGWPWTREVAMLILKYKNVYTDLSCLYFDNAPEFYGQIFTSDLGRNWIDRSLRHQVMFASEEPRLEQRRMIEAVRRQEWRASTTRMVLGENALAFIEGGVIHD